MDHPLYDANGNLRHDDNGKVLIHTVKGRAASCPQAVLIRFLPLTDRTDVRAWLEEREFCEVDVGAPVLRHLLSDLAVTWPEAAEVIGHYLETSPTGQSPPLADPPPIEELIAHHGLSGIRAEVARLWDEGLTDSEIADRLDRAIQTINNIKLELRHIDRRLVPYRR